MLDSTHNFACSRMNTSALLFKRNRPVWIVIHQIIDTVFET